MAYPEWGHATGPIKCRGCKEMIGPGFEVWVKRKGVYYCNGCGLVAEAAGDEIKAGGIEEAFLHDLGSFPDEAAGTTLAIAARYMARQLDCGEVAPREVTLYTKEIRLNLLQIRELYPPVDEQDDTETKREKLQERRRREQGGI